MADRLLVDLFKAYYEARKHKRRTEQASGFEAGFERELFRLRNEIVNREYKVSPSTCFIVFSPVKREIFAGAFRDRIVHHLIFGYLNPLCERVFINDSYSCRKGKGTSYGVKRAEHFVRSCSRNHTHECFVLRLDIRGYFMSIHRKTLYDKILSLVDRYASEIPIDRDLLLWLVRQVVFNDPTKNMEVKGNRRDWVGLPKSKSLFFSGEGRGLPIGILTSQLFANLYLNDFDHFARSLDFGGCGKYGRYVDDLLFISRDEEKLRKIIPVLDRYLRANLGVRLHPKKIFLQSYRKGFSFLGRFILPYRTYLKRSTKGNAINRIRMRMKWYASLVAPTEKQQGSIEACWRSYEGLFMSCKARRLRKRVFERGLISARGNYPPGINHDTFLESMM